MAIHVRRYLERAALERLIETGDEASQVRLRSCQGRNNSRWLSTVPTTEALKLSNTIHQCLLRRRLGLPILDLCFTNDQHRCEGRTCRHTLDEFGHHASACCRTGRIHGRHAASTRPWIAVFKEAGYAVTTERMLQDTRLRVDPSDRRRMDIHPPSRRPGGPPLILAGSTVEPFADGSEFLQQCS